MNRAERVETVMRMCKDHGCSEKVKKIHFEQYVDRQWHPHPPQAFNDFWKTHHDHTWGQVPSKTAWNCQSYRDEFMDMRKYGAA